VIRPATLADLDQITAWGAEFHAASGMLAPFDAEATRVFVARLIEASGAVVLMHERGMIGGLLSPAYCAPQWVIAVELFWWAESGGMALLRAFEAWAKENGASEVRMTTLAALPRAEGVLKRAGYSPAELSHAKVI
jgi:GNAT superfamily N-acetyltransferase